ncbi:hypothetical protein VP01_186g7 [Puccinia sorghi]|uniref:N-acetyltransferase domain-containing protein n=1 Tax=Puccinia sorghi TaxID=27349 RepID=A0A0L6VDE1_9BASI|nr:hypothetical protein VP01_186g7 [Puccinia sorghi]
MSLLRPFEASDICSPSFFFRFNHVNVSHPPFFLWNRGPEIHSETLKQPFVCLVFTWVVSDLAIKGNVFGWVLSTISVYLAKLDEHRRIAESSNYGIWKPLLSCSTSARSFYPAPSQLVMGKMEGENEDFHGHVSAITVAPSYRRLSLARELMKLIESASEQQSCYFVDLFVRVSNALAISMYEHFGYSVYQRVVKYYSAGGVGDHLAEEDAFGLFLTSFCRCPSPPSLFFLPSLSIPKNLINATPLFLADMRKALSLDKDRKSVRENGREVLVDSPSF